MKILYFIILMAFCSSSAQAPETGKSVISKNDQIESNKLDMKILEARLQQASDTINNQNATIASLSTGYTVAGWLLGALAIISTLGVYLFGIRPSEKAISNLQDSMEKEFEIFFKNKKRNELKNAVTLIESESIGDIYNGLYYLSLNLWEPLSDEKIYKLMVLYSKHKGVYNLSQAIIHILNSQKSVLTNSFFKDLLIQQGNYVAQEAAIIYYSREENVDLGFPLLKQKILLNDKNPRAILSNTVNTLSSYGHTSMILKLLEDKDISMLLEDENHRYSLFLTVKKALDPEVLLKTESFKTSSQFIKDKEKESAQ